MISNERLLVIYSRGNMRTVSMQAMKRSDKTIYTVFAVGEQLTREQIAKKTEYSLASITRILGRLQREKHVRAVRLGRKTVYERIS